MNQQTTRDSEHADADTGSAEASSSRPRNPAPASRGLLWLCPRIMPPDSGEDPRRPA